MSESESGGLVVPESYATNQVAINRLARRSSGARGSAPGLAACNGRVRPSVVEAPGIEPRDTSVRSVVKRRANDADLATKDDAKRREVSASTPMSADDAIRVAAKLAIDAGDFARARALLDLLDVERSTMPIAILTPRKSPR